MVRSAEPVARRRRGAELEQAILDAAVAELQRVGYHDLSMEAVAIRAGASKNSVYRRWPSKRRLVLAAVHELLTGGGTVPDTGTVRGDLLEMLRRFAQQLDGPAGVALRVVVAESITSADQEGWRRDHGPSTSAAIVSEIADRAVRRGEIERSMISERSLEVGPALLRQHFLFGGTPIREQVLVSIVDDVIIRLWSGDSGSVEPTPVPSVQ